MATQGPSGEHLGIGGTHSHGGKLFVYNGNAKQALIGGATVLSVRQWHHVALGARRGARSPSTSTVARRSVASLK